MSERGITLITGIFVCLSCFTVAIGDDEGPGPTLNRHGLSLSFDPNRGVFTLAGETGPLLVPGRLHVIQDGKTWHLAHPLEGRLKGDTLTFIFLQATTLDGKTRTALASAATLVFRIPDPERVEITVGGAFRGGAAIDAEVGFADEGPLLPGYLDSGRDRDRRVLVTTLGPAAVPGAEALYAPNRDLALAVDPEGPATWRPEGGWRLSGRTRTGGLKLALTLHRDYFRETLGIEHFAPLTKRGEWTTAPVVAMTWYGIEGWKNAQTREWLTPHIDWVAEKLLPYAGRLVFQLDDNYVYDDDAYMRSLSDLIRSRGLVPGIWFTPNAVAPLTEAEAHPDWFLHDPEGGLLKAFGGVNWNWEGKGAGVLNVTNEEAAKAWYDRFWIKASDTWNFDFFKIDGQPEVARAYRRSADGGGAAGYRSGLDRARKIVGPDKFINACWGTTVDAIGKVDGARTGPDTGNWPHATNVVLRWNFLNNVAWWSDPDAAANLFRADLPRVRHNAQARVLTGQQFLTDDLWTAVPDGIRRVWQRSFPMLDIRPANLYPIEKDWAEYDLFDLRIAKPWGTRDVAGLFNYEGSARMGCLDLGRLPLEGETFLVFDIYEGRFLGRFDRDARLPVELGPYEGRLYGVGPVSEKRPGRPAILGTNRHLLNGAPDLKHVVWTRNGASWILTCEAGRLVPGDAYRIHIHPGDYELIAAHASGRPVKIMREGITVVIEALPEDDGTLDFRADFRPRSATALEITPTAIRLDVESGTESGIPAGARPASVSLRRLGAGTAAWRAEPSDPRIVVDPCEGRAEGHDETTVTVDLVGLEPDTSWEGSVAFRCGEFLTDCPVRLRVPLPENLALKAEAKASSRWGADFDASRIRDGLRTTRWNSGAGDLAGAWVELRWDAPVEIRRIHLDECMDYGPRVRSWRVELRDGTEGAGRVVARGADLGSLKKIVLPEPVTAGILRLVVEEAVDVPTLWEFSVYGR